MAASIAAKERALAVLRAKEAVPGFLETRRANARAVRAAKKVNDPEGLRESERLSSLKKRTNMRKNHPAHLSNLKRLSQERFIQKVKDREGDFFAEFMRNKFRERDDRRKARDPEAYRSERSKNSRRRYAELKSSDPDKLRAKAKRSSMRSQWRNSKNRNSNSIALYKKICALLPPGMPLDVQQDISASMMLSVIEGAIDARQIAAHVKSYKTAHYRMFDGFKTSSLDEVIPGTDNLRRIDTIASDDPHF